jgi:hypothetical protein
MDHRDVALNETPHIHFVEHGFAPDGGMSEKWEVIWAGPVPIGLPNISPDPRSPFRSRHLDMS